MWKKIIGFHNDAAGRQLTVLQDVYKSESDTNQRNQAIGALMLAYGYIKSNWQQAVDLYTRQCSIGVNARDLAMMAATLAAGGKNPVTSKQVMDAAKVPGVLAVMATAGLYDDSGKWLYLTGLPAKSGVGGGLIAVSPGKFGIAVVSPPLDDAGNSVSAQSAIADISNALGGNPYAAGGKLEPIDGPHDAQSGVLHDWADRRDRLRRWPSCRTRALSRSPATDVVTLANGDRITGEIIVLERGRLEFKTDDAGTLYFEWDKLVQLVATRQVEVLHPRRDALPRHPGGQPPLVRWRSSTIGGTITLRMPDVTLIDTHRHELLEEGRWLDRCRASTTRSRAASRS